MVELLIKLEANVNAKGSKYYTALHASALSGNHEVMRHLLDVGADVNANGGMFGTALQAALHHGFHICTGILLDHGAKVNLTGGVFWCALESTLEQACWGLFRKLISKHNTDVNIEGGPFGFPLQKAIYNKKKSDKSVKYLLEKGADPNKTGGIFGTAMNAAAAKADLESIELLLEHGADINLNYGQLWWSPLQSASLQAHVDVVKLFLTKGAKVNDRGGTFGTALQSASYGSYENIVNMLIKASADVNSDIPTGRHSCPLQAAAVSGKQGVVRALLDHGAKSKFGYTWPISHLSASRHTLLPHRDYRTPSQVSWNRQNYNQRKGWPPWKCSQCNSSSRAT
jgi:ankyrin repeat protein